MKRLLSFFLLLFFSPFLILAGAGFYYGYDVPSGMLHLFPTLTGNNVIYDVPPVFPEDLMPALQRVVTWKGELEDESLTEASGLVASSISENVFFSVNDSGNEPKLFAMDDRGKDLGSWPLAFNTLHDFEDLAAFQLDGESYLLVADTGDNLYWRPSLTMLIFREPRLSDPGTALRPAWSFQFTYPDGPRDSEAVAVDVSAGNILLLSKLRVPSELYRLPIKPVAQTVVAEKIGRLNALPQPTQRDLREDPEWGEYRSAPTAMDIRGRVAIVITYRDAWLYKRKLRASWADAFSEVPERVALPYIHGLESGAFSRSGSELVVVGERDEDVGRMGVYEVKL